VAGTPKPALRAPADAGSARASWVSTVPILVPAIVIGVGGWLHRWMDEDAFINFRVVDQVFAGHGPVFNAGQRVEAFTSPLWLAVLVGGRAVCGTLMRIQWVALVAGLAFAVGAFTIGAYASRIRRARDEIVVPVGLLLVAVIPVMWDFASSGLEMSLVWLWLATCWFALVKSAVDPVVSGRARLLSTAVLGLGPVVRPELGLITVSLLAAWFAIVRPRRVVHDLAVALAIPVAYEVFRAGYYATVVPNTGLAKGSGSLHPRQGWNYLYDLLHTYVLWIPFLVTAVVIVVNLLESRDRPLRIATAAMLTGAVLDGGYIVATGGDYMHGRLLLPAVFAFALPASILLRPQALPTYGILCAGIIWAVVCAASMRYPSPKPTFGVSPIADWRLVLGKTMFPKQATALALTGLQVHRTYEAGTRGYLRVLDTAPRPGTHRDLLVVTMGSIGVPAYNAGRQVFVVDIGGLAEPIAARTSAISGRAAGHRKSVDPAWYDAEFGAEHGDSNVAAARRALSCQPVSGLLRAINAPLTPSRFLSNVWHSVSYTFLRVPSNPVTAVREFCPAKPP
jgi:arabinofuranosyltransferase